MAENLKSKAIKGGIWSGVQSFGTSFMLFVCNIVLARLLTPSDFGCVGMLLVFIAISDAIVDGGFVSALIQKSDADEDDYSTIFWWNIVLSLFLYIILYVSSPTIAHFYGMEQLSEVLKVYGIVLLLHGLSLVQRTIFVKKLNFKIIAAIDLCANFLGTIIAIISAFCGAGIWSLIVKVLITGFVAMVILWVKSQWYPKFIFKWTNLCSLFSFGSFVFLSTIINTLYRNVISLILGRSFSPATLGYFTQARKLEDVPRQTISAVITRVVFPVFTNLTEDRERFKKGVKSALSLLSFISFPISVLFIVIAQPLVLFLFGDIWLPAAGYMKVICIYSLMMSIIDLEQEVLKALGKSKLLFYSGLLRRIIGILLIVLGSFFGIRWLLVAYVFSQYISFVIVTYPMKKLIDFSIIAQTIHMLPCLLVCIVSGMISSVMMGQINSASPLLLLSISSVVFLLIFVFTSFLFKIDGCLQIIKLLKKH